MRAASAPRRAEPEPLGKTAHVDSPAEHEDAPLDRPSRRRPVLDYLPVLLALIAVLLVAFDVCGPVRAWLDRGGHAGRPRRGSPSRRFPAVDSRARLSASCWS